MVPNTSSDAFVPESVGGRSAAAAPIGALGVSKSRRRSAQVDSYDSIVEELYPDYCRAFQIEIDPHLDEEAVRMNELRGLVLGQSSETETVLLWVLYGLQIKVSHPKTAGRIREALDKYFERERASDMVDERRAIRDAVHVRNKVAHEHINIGSTWREYATGGGEWVSVISLLGDVECDENDMLRYLDLQLEATRAAIRIRAELEDWDGQVREFERVTREDTELEPFEGRL